MTNFQNIAISVVLVFSLIMVATQGQLRIGYYTQTCPTAESVVTAAVKKATILDPGTPANLLRLHFHDCFVEGCDGSILIDGPTSERKANEHIGLQGLNKITNAKQDVEAQCPGVVSCADIVALAARDAVVLTGGPFYEVETGRKDGRVSNESHARDMPDVNDSIDTLKSKFMSKGLAENELVLLSGAHTIGLAACFFMPKRLYNFTGLNDSDPSINPSFLSKLKHHCPKNGSITKLIHLDPKTPWKFDNQVMRNNKTGNAVVASDARLYDDMVTRQVVDFYAGFASSFLQDFTAAMILMGRIGVKTGDDGEIRRVCESFN